MSAQTTAANTLKEFGARASTIISDAELADVSSVDAVPTRTDADGNALQPFGFHVGVAGNVKLTTLGGNTLTLAFAAGDHPWAVTTIHAAGEGTTATGLAFLYGERKSKPGALT